MSNTSREVTAAEAILRALHDQGVEYLFANYGTDHTPLIEAAARIRRDDGAMPEIVVSPHEFVALSAAHGFAAISGRLQAVLVHVDVGTQNLGAAMHNAHRSNVPVVVLAGLAPVTDAGHPGSRDNVVHYLQDTFDQRGIVEEYCRWTTEYRPPADPAATVARAISRATAPPAGPTYIDGSREALEAQVAYTPRGEGRPAVPSGADAATVAEIVERVAAAAAPLVITSRLGSPPAGPAVEALVSFAEAAGAGVIEHSPASLCFPRDHPQHAGFSPGAAFEHADLLVLADTDVPWVPSAAVPPDDVPVIQIDPDPTKPAYPHWDFPVDYAVAADPARTLAAVTGELEPGAGDAGRDTWREMAAARRERVAAKIEEERNDGRLTASTLSTAVDDIVDGETVVVADAVTNTSAVLNGVTLREPGSYLAKYGSGLGFAGGAAVGAKMAAPEKRVLSLVGDGSYLFSHPSVSAWLAAERGAPTLTVIYDNGGWSAVRSSTARAHPEGIAIEDGVPESRFDHPLDFTAPAKVVDAHTASVGDLDEVAGALDEAVEAVDAGRPAVVHARIE